MRSTAQWTTVASATALLMACGGDGSPDPVKAKFKPGDVVTVTSRSGSEPAQAQQLILYGITSHGELVDTETPALLDNAFVPLAASADAKSSDPAAASPPSLAALRETYRRLWAAYVAELQTTDPARLTAEIDDLDGNLVELTADLARSGMSDAEYVAFYQALDEGAMGNVQEAEAELRAFIDDIEKQEANSPSESAKLQRYPLIRKGSIHAQLAVAAWNAGLSWAEFVKLINQRGDSFGTIHALYLQRVKEGRDELQSVVEDYINGSLKASVSKFAVIRSGTTVVSPSSVIFANEDPTEDWMPTTGNPPTFFTVLSSSDSNPRNYQGAKQMTLEPQSVEWRVGDVVQAAITYAPVLQYAATHRAAGSGFMPNLSFSVTKLQAPAGGAISASATATLVNDGEWGAATSVPEVTVRPSLYIGGWRNYRPKLDHYLAHGENGLSRVVP